MTSLFHTNEPSLNELLAKVHGGNLRLPDFQRGWVWDDDHIRSLLASISRAFPIGCIMMLETGGESVHYKTRLVEGVPEGDYTDATSLLLDGQQRMTSLYLALKSKEPVPTRSSKNQKINRHYYFDMRKCIDATCDREDAIVSVPEDRIVRKNIGRDIALDLHNQEQEFEMRMFPADRAFDYAGWRRNYTQFVNHDREALDLFDEFERQILETVKQYRIPAIELTRDTPKEAVCIVFEKVNTGGVPLTVFELTTATYAADEFDLRADWDARRARLAESKALDGVSAPDFLTAITLLSSWRNSADGRGVSCKRRDILNLSLDSYKAAADSIEKGLHKASQLLASEHVFETRNIPYGSQLIPLSAILAALETHAESVPVKQKLARWFWCGVFGELYGGANESRFALDIVDVLRWADGGDEPRTIRDFVFQPTRLLTLRTRQSAAYKGLFALLMNAGSPDFINGDELALTNYFDLQVDIHHLFPKKWCIGQDLDRSIWDSVVNKTPLTARTNRIIGGKAPSEYLRNIERKQGVEPRDLDRFLRQHLVDPDAIRSDNFHQFIQLRAAMLLDAIEHATGRSIAGRDADDVQQQFGGPVTTGLVTA